MNLTGKVAIVTGGARDIGKAVSIALAAAGAKVMINYNSSEEQAKSTLDEIKSTGGEGAICKGDMTNAADVKQLMDATAQLWGNEIHILVNTAGGLFARKQLAEQDETFYDLVMNVNLKSVFLATQAVVPFMKEGASIINFSSQAGRDGGGGGASLYATAKGAVMTYTRAMAKELGPKGIRVNAVAPGMIATSFHDQFTKPEIRTAVAGATPLRRQGAASEVADLVCYLAGAQSSFITGANVDINGGTYFS